MKHLSKKIIFMLILASHAHQAQAAQTALVSPATQAAELAAQTLQSAKYYWNYLKKSMRAGTAKAITIAQKHPQIFAAGALGIAATGLVLAINVYKQRNASVQKTTPTTEPAPASAPATTSSTPAEQAVDATVQAARLVPLPATEPALTSATAPAAAEETQDDLKRLEAAEEKLRQDAAREAQKTIAERNSEIKSRVVNQQEKRALEATAAAKETQEDLKSLEAAEAQLRQDAAREAQKTIAERNSEIKSRVVNQQEKRALEATAAAEEAQLEALQNAIMSNRLPMLRMTLNALKKQNKQNIITAGLRFAVAEDAHGQRKGLLWGEIQELLTAKADPLAVDPKTHASAFMTACDNDDVQLVQEFVRATDPETLKAALNDYTQGFSHLFVAVLNNLHPEIIRILQEAGAKFMNAKEELFYALRYADVKAAQDAIERGALVGFPIKYTNQRCTECPAGSCSSNFTALDGLFTNRYSENEKVTKGSKKALYANEDTVCQLLELLSGRGTTIDVNSQVFYSRSQTADQKTASPLFIALQKGHLKVAAKLVELGANITSHDIFHYLLRHEKALEAHELIKIILETKSDGLDTAINHQDAANRELLWTPLMWAIRNGKINVASLLIKHGAKVKAQHLEYGMTALHYVILALKSKYMTVEAALQIITELLNKGADCTIKDHDKVLPVSALEYAKSCKLDQKIIDLLESSTDQTCGGGGGAGVGE